MSDDILRDLRIQLFARPFDFEGGRAELDEILEMVRRAVYEFSTRDTMLKLHKCPHCSNRIPNDTFDNLDRSYRDEFNISNLCPKCQDEVFANVESTNECA